MLHHTAIESYNAPCENALDIINSQGQLDEVIVQDAFQDAIDFDASNLTAAQVDVRGAGNDCLDVSYGFYIFEDVELTNCADKGVSVGEISEVELETLAVNTASIALAVKDGANTRVNELIGENVDTCVAAYQKKQEFLGGTVSLSSVSCTGLITADLNSHVEQGS